MGIEDAVSYCPETGLFRWKVKTHNIALGDIAGNLSLEGYWVLTLKGKKYQAHRVAWLIMTGQWPAAFIDHKNLDRADNRWANLRPATRQQNLANSPNFGAFSKGVTRTKSGRYRAQITVHGRRLQLGLFDSDAAAHAAYVASARAHFGEFARAG